MLLRSTIAFAFLTIVLTAKSGIDLTPTANEYVSEGIKYQKLILRQDKQVIEYNPPPGWKFDGGPDQLRLTPPKKDFAEAVIEAAPLSKPETLNQDVTNALAQQFIVSLPPGSQFVTVVSEEQNPVPVDGKPSFEVTASYQLMGEKFLRSALFVNLANTQLTFRLTARKDDFQTLHREFKTSIFSWHWTEPDQAVPEVAKNAEQAPVR